MHLCGLCFFFSFCSLWCHKWQHQPWTADQERKAALWKVSAVTCQICKGTWLPLLSLALQKYIEMPVDRCSEMWFALGISSKPVLFLVSDSHYSVPGKLTTAVHSGRAQMSFMCMLTRKEELKSADISKAWVLASFPAFTHLLLL